VKPFFFALRQVVFLSPTAHTDRSRRPQNEELSDLRLNGDQHRKSLFDLDLKLYILSVMVT
jgi:hypothetical protein